MKKIISIVLVWALLGVSFVYAEEAPASSETSAAEVETNFEVAPEDGVNTEESDMEIAEEAPMEDLESPVSEEGEDELIPTPSVVGSGFEPFLDYAADPMAQAKALGVYETDLSSGAATYSYPIYLPPGRVELMPTVSLSYNNQGAASDSIVGYGWDLFVGGSITRTSEYGFFETYDTNEFYLSMAGASGKLLPVSLDDDEHGDYGLQVEEAFYKYEFESDDSWVVTDQNGVKYYFGQDVSSRQDDPDDSTRIFEWYLDEIVDLQGNYVRFEYFEDQGRVYPDAIYYTGYGTDDGPFEVDFSYTTRSDWTLWYDKGFEVKTEYILDEVAVYYEGDLVRYYDLAYTVGENGLRAMLESISETGYSLEGDSVTLPETSFEYSDNELSYNYSTQSSTVEDVYGYYFSDVNRDGVGDQCLIDDVTTSGYSYAYCAENNGDGTSFGASYSDIYYYPTYVGAELGQDSTLLDGNGDMAPELYVMQASTPSSSDNCIYYNYGEGFMEDISGSTCPVGVSSIYTSGFRYGDFDGDGLSDLFTGYNNGEWTMTGSNIYLNNGEFGFDDSTYDSPMVFGWGYNTSPAFRTEQDSGARLADFNGDGLVDIIWAYMDRNYDFNTADDDPAVIKYYLNTGDGSFVESSEFYLGVNPFVYIEYDNYWHPESSYYSSANDTCLMDFNTDGVLDIVISGGVYVWDGVDTVTAASVSSGNVNCGGIDWSTHTISNNVNDLDGDGMVDFLSSYNGYPSYTEVSLSGFDKPDLLTSVVTSGGVEVDIEYESALESGENPDLPFPVYVVSNVTTSDGLGNDSVISYDYSGGAYYKLFDGYKGSFTGFDEVTVVEDGVITVYYFDTGCRYGEMCSFGIDPGTFISVGSDWYVADGNYLRDVSISFSSSVWGSTYFATDDLDFVDFFEIGEDWDDSTDDFMYEVDYSQHSLKGKPTMIEVYDDVGVLYSRTVNEWSADDLGDDRYFPHIDQVIEFSFEGETAAREIANSYEYNTTYGVLLTETQWGEVEADESTYEITDYMIGDEVYVSNSYAENSSDWVVKNAEILVEDGDGMTLSDTEFYYDDDSDLGDIGDGFLTTQSVWLDTDSSWLDMEYEYDCYGNVVSFVDPRGNETSVVYDADSFYPAEITNSLGQTQYYDVNYLNGQPAEVTDLNSYVYTYLYDGVGRIKSVTGPSVDGSSTVTHASYEYDDSAVPRYVLETLMDDTSDGFNTYTYLDGLGREVQVATEGESDWILVDLTYTDRGEIESESLPYFSGDGAVDGTWYVYDSLGRVIEVTTGLGTTYTDYGVWAQTLTDSLGNMKNFYYDAYGNLIQVEEDNDGAIYSTYYEYDLLGRLVEITDAFGNVRDFEWDSLGRIVMQEEMHDVSDVNYAEWNYEYDENGNLVWVLTPNGDEIDYSYDELDRVLSEEDIDYSYDDFMVGFLDYVTDDAGTVTYEYDALGGVVSEVREIDERDFETSFVNDLMGRVTEVTYPSGSVVSYEFNEGGMVESVSFDGDIVVSDLDYSPAGQWEYFGYANGDNTTNTYDSDQMYFLTNKYTVSGSGEVLQDLEYSYDSVGNILSIVDDADVSLAKDYYYEYDDLYRLVEAIAESIFIDSDSDYVSDSDELVYGTDAGDSDSDDDGLIDGYEIYVYGSDPLSDDSDGDSFSDYDELYYYGSDMMVDDTLNYIEVDGMEYSSGYNYTILYNTHPDTVETSYSAGCMRGDYCIEMSITGNSFVYGRTYFHLPAVVDVSSLASSGEFRFWLKVIDGYENVNRVSAWIGSDSGNFSECEFDLPTDDQWHLYSTELASCSSYIGSTDFSNVDYLQFKVNAPTTDLDVVFDGFEVAEMSVTPEYDYSVLSAHIDSFYEQTYEYDEIGNMTYKSDIGDLLYEQNGNANVYAVTSADSYSFDYDANGNVLSDGIYDYEFNYKNQMIASSDGSEYLYDFAGSRLQKNETYYPNMFYEEDGDVIREYVFVDGVRVFVNEYEHDFYQADKVAIYTDDDSEWDYVEFDREFESTPIVFAQVQEENGSHDIKVDLKEIDEEGFYLMQEEDRGSDDSWLDGTHAENNVAYVAFEVDDLPEGAYGGIENFIGAPWVTQTVTFDEPFDETPVVYAQIQTENGAQTARVRIISVDVNGFDMQVEEDMGNGTSGGWDGWHTYEDVAWIAFDPDENPFGGMGGMTDIDSNWTRTWFENDSGYQTFEDYPLVFAMPVTRNETDNCIPDIRIVYRKAFDMRLEELDLAGWDGVHVAESVSWFAIGELL